MATRSDELTRVLKLAYEAKNFDAAGDVMFICWSLRVTLPFTNDLYSLYVCLKAATSVVQTVNYQLALHQQCITCYNPSTLILRDVSATCWCTAAPQQAQRSPIGGSPPEEGALGSTRGASAQDAGTGATRCDGDFVRFSTLVVLKYH